MWPFSRCKNIMLVLNLKSWKAPKVSRSFNWPLVKRNAYICLHKKCHILQTNKWNFFFLNLFVQPQTEKDGHEGGGVAEEAGGGREEGQTRRNRSDSRVHISGYPSPHNGQIHQHFTRGFFVRKFCAQLFWTYILGFYFFWRKNICAKAALRMLVELTPYPFHLSLSAILCMLSLPQFSEDANSPFFKIEIDEYKFQLITKFTIKKSK